MSGTSKVKLLSIKTVAILVESFPAFSGRTESRDLICTRHTYQNDKVCKTIVLLKSYENRTKALENRPPRDFLGERTDGPMP